MTPTSATGACDRGRRRAGFTLVELLVTVAIIGLAAGVAVLAAPDGRPRADVEAQRLATRLVRAREEALLSNRLVAVEIDAAGHRVTAWDLEAWVPIVDGPFRPAAWPEGLAVGPPPEARVIFDPVGVAGPAVVSLRAGGASSTVTVDAAGEVRLEHG